LKEAFLQSVLKKAIKQNKMKDKGIHAGNSAISHSSVHLRWPKMH